MDLSPDLLSYCTQSSWNSPSSDSDHYNASSPETASPSPCADVSLCTQPHHLPTSLHLTPHGDPKSSTSPSSCEDHLISRGRPRRTRSKNPSKQRQNASEKEKLRMRDLTKALHHLRTYLPPTVAPAGQTLTKIETLRLAIRYISHLSAQLGLGEEFLRQRKELRPSHTGICHYSSVPEAWRMGNGGTTYAGYQHSAHRAQSHYSRVAVQHSDGVGMEVPVCDQRFSSNNLDSLMEGPLYADTAPSHQDYSKVVYYENMPEFWI